MKTERTAGLGNTLLHDASFENMIFPQGQKNPEDVHTVQVSRPELRLPQARGRPPRSVLLTNAASLNETDSLPAGLRLSLAQLFPPLWLF